VESSLSADLLNISAGNEFINSSKGISLSCLKASNSAKWSSYTPAAHKLKNILYNKQRQFWFKDKQQHYKWMSWCIQMYIFQDFHVLTAWLTNLLAGYGQQIAKSRRCRFLKSISRLPLSNCPFVTKTIH